MLVLLKPSVPKKVPFPSKVTRVDSIAPTPRLSVKPPVLVSALEDAWVEVLVLMVFANVSLDLRVATVLLEMASKKLVKFVNEGKSPRTHLPTCPDTFFKMKTIPKRFMFFSLNIPAYILRNSFLFVFMHTY